MKQFSYAEVVAKADSIKAVMGDSPTVYLTDGPDMPFDKAFDFEPGGTIRLGTSTSGYFTAKVKGIACRWSFDLEEWGANGSGLLAPRVDAIREVMAKLDGRPRQQFRAWLVEVADKMRTDAAEIRARADTQAAKAATIGDIAGIAP